MGRMPLRPRAADAITIDEMPQQATIINRLEEPQDQDWRVRGEDQKPADENG